MEGRAEVRGGRLPAAVALLACTLGAQTAPKPILGTVTGFRVDTLEFGVKPDSGKVVMVKVGPETDVVAVPPGERGLEKAKPARVTDIAPGDRVLVSFVDGLTDARRIVLIPAGEIVRRNEAERRDWQLRGTSGIVASVRGGEISLEQRTPGAVKTVVLTVDEDTKVRRYAPDSVKFTEAQAAAVGEIAVGDQVQARGRKSEDGTQVAAEEIVFGTFLTKLGKITSVDAEAKVVRMEDLATKKPLTIRVTAASQLKMLPDMRSMFAAMVKAGKEHHDAPGSSPAGEPFDIKRTLEQLPAASLAELKVGTMVIVTSTRGASSDQLTAIMLLANADSLIQMAQMQAGDNVSPMQAISGLHGGALSGPGGLSLPAILQ